MAVLEGTLALDIGIVVFLDSGIAELVALGLAGLSEQDQRCGVGRLGRECEVEEDERVRVPPEGERGGVKGDPDDDQYWSAR